MPETAPETAEQKYAKEVKRIADFIIKRDGEDSARQKGGFCSPGYFYQAVALGYPESRKTYISSDKCGVKALDAWREIQQKAPSGLFEGSDPDGGLLVPSEYANDIYIRAKDANQLLRYLSPRPMRNRQQRIPALLENSRADGSRLGGVQSYWSRESDQYRRTKPQYRDIQLELHKLTIELVVTEELLEDTDGLADHLTEVASQEINFVINNAVINGTGAGVPRGLLASGSKITVPAVATQGNGTVIAQNVLDIWSRVTPSQRNSVVWLMNQDVEPSLLRAFVAAGEYGTNAIISRDATGNLQLCGRPAITIEQCSSIGTEGDIIAFATDGYACGFKRSSPEAMVSMHVNYEFDERIYKFRFRFDGQAKDNTPLTPYKGTATTSSIVTLSSTRT